MLQASIRFAWRDAEVIQRFRTGVSLHGHTMHSEECLNFLPRYLRQIPGGSRAVKKYESGPNPVDFNRAYWTPPLSPSSALTLEQTQILAMGMRPLVSLTDHDNIEAGISLLVTADARDLPVSVEWTVPYERSILHLGIHNLPCGSARAWMSAFTAHTADPREERLPGILSELARTEDVLIVLNHPFWLEEGVQEADHRRALDRVLRECLPWFHAFELNGTRGWKENAGVVELARAHGRPVISGGDRHACEPSACLNLTNATGFSEFAAEIREGHSSIVFMPQYREPMAMRILGAAREILRLYPEYPGRERWTDRIFYRGEDHIARPVSAIWKDKIPLPLRAITAAVQLSATTQLRGALRALLAERGEILP